MLEALTACAIVAAWRGGEGHIMTNMFDFLKGKCSVAVWALGGAYCDANSGACDVISILYTVVCADGDSVAWKCDGSWTRHWSEFVVGCSVRYVMVLQGAGCTMLFCLAAMWKVADNCIVFLVDPLNVLTIQRPSWSAHHAATQCIGLLSCCHAMEGAVASVLVGVAGRQAWILDCLLLLALCAIQPALKTKKQDMPICAAVVSILQHWQGGMGATLTGC